MSVGWQSRSVGENAEQIGGRELSDDCQRSKQMQAKIAVQLGLCLTLPMSVG